MDSLLPKSKVCAVSQDKIPGCGKEKLLEEFDRRKSGKYGRRSKCKACMAEYSKQYYKDNKEKMNEVSKKYHEENKEQIKKRQAERIKYLIENDLLPKSKVCAGECGEEKLLKEFEKHAVCKYGRASQCKACRGKYKKQYRQDNPEKMAEQGKQYRHNNKETISEWHKQHYQENKEEISEYGKQYRKANKEKIAKRIKQWYQDNRERVEKQRKQYYLDNKEKIKQYRQDNKEHANELERTRRKNDEQFRIRHNLSCGLWQALNDIGKRKNASILTYIGCSIEYMKEHLNSTKKTRVGRL